MRRSIGNHAFAVLMALWACIAAAWADLVEETVVRDAVVAPYSLGPLTDIDGVWELLNGSGLQEGYVIQSEILSPLPGFSGAPMNMMIMMDLDGVFIDVKLLNQNEPIFVSGLGEAPFLAFLEQYRGLSLNTPTTVGSAYGADSGGSLVYLDGVTKATASVRIAHESIMAAARDVAKQKFQGYAAPQVNVSVKQGLEDVFTWDALVAEGIARQFIATHGEIRALFAGTQWADDDPFPGAADSDPYVDLWVVDVTAEPVARAVMKDAMFREWSSLGDVAPNDETLLLIETADHGLVTDDFVRNTSPATIEAVQDGFPLPLRDADLLIDLRDEVPEGRAMVLRIDRRLGFNPIREWELGLLSLREHGIFRPEIGQQRLSWNYAADERFYIVEKPPRQLTPFESAIVGRQTDLILLCGFLTVVFAAMFLNARFVKLRQFQPLRLAILAGTLGFIGWWGQGQLSIVTPLGALVGALAGKSLAFLLYDPFSLLIWGAAIVGFLIWGRALFCGWLCPFGAMQEFAGRIAAFLNIKQIRVSDVWDARLKLLKYVVLAALVAVAVYRPEHVDKAAEVEPFKTAISVFFVREWYYVAYALACLLASLFVFKAYCRYLCPLGALMAIGGWLRITPWIARRTDCGSPCQLCKNKCQYGAIAKTGEIDYSECFGCLDCVDIYEDEAKCVPLILAAKRREKAA